MAKKTEVASVPVNESLKQRVADIEARWGKEFMEVVCDLHDHVFGVSDPAPAEVDPPASVDQPDAGVGDPAPK